MYYGTSVVNSGGSMLSCFTNNLNMLDDEFVKGTLVLSVESNG